MPAHRKPKPAQTNSKRIMRSTSPLSSPNLSASFVPRSTLLSPFAFLRRSPLFYSFLTLATLCLMLGLTALLALTLSAPASTPHLLTAAPAPSPPQPTPAGPPTTSQLVTLASYPHDSRCFTQGLEWYDGTLYESCGMYRSSNVRTVDLNTGNTLATHKLNDKYFAEGLTIFNHRIYQLTWQERDVLVYSPDLSALPASRIETDGWGVTHNGSHIITTDGSAYLYFREPDSMKLLTKRRVTRLTDGGDEVEVAALNELEWHDGLLYANVWMQPVILCIEPTSARVLHIFNANAQLVDAGGDSHNKVANGIAYRPTAAGGGKGQWYMTGKYWPKLYEVDLTLPAGVRR